MVHRSKPDYRVIWSIKRRLTGTRLFKEGV